MSGAATPYIEKLASLTLGSSSSSSGAVAEGKSEAVKPKFQEQVQAAFTETYGSVKDCAFIKPHDIAGALSDVNGWDFDATMAAVQAIFKGSATSDSKGGLSAPQSRVIASMSQVFAALSQVPAPKTKPRKLFLVGVDYEALKSAADTGAKLCNDREITMIEDVLEPAGTAKWGGDPEIVQKLNATLDQLATMYDVLHRILTAAGAEGAYGAQSLVASGLLTHLLPQTGAKNCITTASQTVYKALTGGTFGKM